jgi:hypothetical protein
VVARRVRTTPRCNVGAVLVEEATRERVAGRKRALVVPATIISTEAAPVTIRMPNGIAQVWADAAPHYDETALAALNVATRQVAGSNKL